MSNWRMAFDCFDCANTVDKDGHRYCRFMMVGEKVIHADDDYVLRCDKYKPRQLTFSEAMAMTRGCGK